VSAGRQLGLIIVALLALSCGGADRVAVDELPVPPGLDPGACSYATLGAIAHRDLAEIRKLKARGAVGNCEATQWDLYNAIYRDEPQLVAVLMAAGVDPEARLVAPDGCSPPLLLAFRLREGNVADEPKKTTFATGPEILRLLLEAGATFSEEWPSPACLPGAAWPEHASGLPPMVAAIAGDVEFVRLLIAAGADVMVTDTRGRTALDYAALGKRPENREAIAELLREAMAKQAGR